MITKTIEFFAILEDGEGPMFSRIADIFDSFEEARSHINDVEEDGELKGRYKYCQFFSSYQGCSIVRYLATPEMRYIRYTDEWIYKNGKFIKHYNWDEEHPYEGRFW